MIKPIFTHFTVYFIILLNSWIIFHCVNEPDSHDPFIVYGQLGCFHFQTIMNRLLALNIYNHISLGQVIEPIGNTSRNSITVSCGISISIFWRISPWICIVAVPVLNHINSKSVFPLLHVHTYIYYHLLFWILYYP